MELQTGKDTDQTDDLPQPDTVEQEELDDKSIKIPWYYSWKTWLKICVVLMIIVAITMAIVYNKQTGSALTSFLQWMEKNPALGAFAFICVYWFCTIFFIPGSLLTFGAGFVFRAVAGPWAGVPVATLVVFIGASLGATSAFLLGRFVFRDSVAGYKTKYPKFAIIDKVVEQQGLKVTILLRLSPIIPFNVFNYAMGLTAVRFRDYNIAHFGMIPGTLAYCFIGGTLGAIGETVGFGDPTILIITICLTVVAIIGMVYISWVAKKQFSKIAAEAEQQAMDADPDAGLPLDAVTTIGDGTTQDDDDGTTKDNDDTPDQTNEESKSLTANAGS